MDVHVRAAVAPQRRRAAGAGPDVVLASGAVLAVRAAITSRRLCPLRWVPGTLLVATACAWRPRLPLVPALAGDALRLVFATGALAESLLRGRPALAFVGLAPIDRRAARRRARRRTAVTAAAVLVIGALSARDA
jgi:hypothetical protein